MDAQKLAERLLEGVDRIAEIATLGEQDLARSYGPGKWNGVELIAHLADADSILHTRVCFAIAEPGITVLSFDENKWVASLGASTRPLEISIGLITATREALAHLARTTPAATLEKAHVVKDGQRLTALQIIEKVCTHGEHHLEQLEAIRDHRQWVAK
ncbi:hypothetical protein GC173_18945 [bacterium]|nr:hypothetical protein [bacterium]